MDVAHMIKSECLVTLSGMLVVLANSAQHSAFVDLIIFLYTTGFPLELNSASVHNFLKLFNNMVCFGTQTKHQFTIHNLQDFCLCRLHQHAPPQAPALFSHGK
jgi:hypothetical protein